MALVNRQWLLASRPEGMVSIDNFKYREQAVNEPDLNKGEILVRNLYLSFDPAMRGWMEDAPSYLPPAPLMEPMRASGVAQVVESGDDNFPVGSLVQGLFGWQDYALCSAKDLVAPRLLPEGLPPSMALGIFGSTGLTAYFGLLRVGEPKAGETVLVSGAAGATGSTVLQIAKIKGCKVIGIAGSSEKCAWLTEELGADGAIDYRNENVEQRLAELCPDGVDVFFDNVGGDILQHAIDHMAQNGRIVLCGAISQYNDKVRRPGPNNLTNLIKFRIRMQGFILLDYLNETEAAIQDLSNWTMDGKLVGREDIQHGFENIPATLLRLFEGKNNGKQLLKLSDPE